MERAGEKRHFFPLTSLQIGYVFRGDFFSNVLGICRAVVARLPAIRPPAAGCRLAGEVLVLIGIMERNGFWRSFFSCCELRCFTAYKVVKIAM